MKKHEIGSIKIHRTFKSWLYELVKKFGVQYDKSSLKMYYNGGYSPKMAAAEILKIPIGWQEL